MARKYRTEEEKARIARIRAKATTYLRSLGMEELSFILGRYCGPSNQILCEKKFGYIMPKDLVEKELEDRTVEEYLLK